MKTEEQVGICVPLWCIVTRQETTGLNLVSSVWFSQKLRTVRTLFQLHQLTLQTKQLVVHKLN
jgi:hypothetical protein